MTSTKTLLLATAFAVIVTLPAYATEQPAPMSGTVPDAAMDTKKPEMPEWDVATPEPETMTPPAAAAEPATTPSQILEPGPTLSAEPPPAVDTPADPVVEQPAVTTPPAEEPVKVVAPVKKKAAPAKLSALSKKYGLMDLDTDGNKSLSREEFTANGFANDKVFNRFDRDGNGKLTNSEINAYASVIEANSKR